MTTTTTILITGSRDWPDPIYVHREMERAVNSFGAQNISFLHGGCPKGVDSFVYNTCLDRAYDQEVVPAEWNKYGKSAGPARNRQMVDVYLPNYCLAFIWNNSKGATQCAHYAWRRGVATYVWAGRDGHTPIFFTGEEYFG
jgi:hypothetical protein